MIECRNRLLRNVLAICSPFLAGYLGYKSGVWFASWFELYELLGRLLGANLGAFLAGWIVSHSIVSNKTFTAFVTLDPLAAFFGAKDPYVSYGPGSHASFPWEQRSEANVVNLIEVPEEIKVEVQGKGGSFHIDGSVRLRPDIKHLREYLTGAAVVVGDVGDLIVAQITPYLSDTSVKDGLQKLKELNEMLRKEFEEGKETGSKVSKFEGRFGVIIGDVTIATIKPSIEVQKALDGAAESAALNNIVPGILGYMCIEDVHTAVGKKEITNTDVVAATKLAMAMTDNLHGMTVNDQNIKVSLDLNDLDPEIAQALAGVAPAVAAVFAAKQGGAKASRQPKKGSTP